MTALGWVWHQTGSHWARLSELCCETVSYCLQLQGRNSRFFRLFFVVLGSLVLALVLCHKGTKGGTQYDGEYE